MTTSSLSLTDMHVAFGGNRVLEGVNLEFGPGFNGLIGPNGAGKTTIFNVISGFVNPSQGEVRLEGKSINGLSQTARVARGIGRTFQAPKLILDATVIENALLGYHHRFRWGHFAELIKLPAARREETEARRECMDLLERFGLADDAHELAGNLSLGNQKIIEVARALLGKPSVVLLDEPAAGLGADDVTILLKGITQSVTDDDLCLVIIEHDLELVTTLCPIISVLHFGRIISQGTPEEVTSDPTVIEAYLGPGFDNSEMVDLLADDGGDH
ncbi:MAG: ABC transporter ATP-binding protein [Acidimicrobiales bacterium]